MSNFKMSIFIFVFLISTKSYSFSSFCSLKKIWWKWLKMKNFPYVSYIILHTCQAQLKHCNILPCIIPSLYFLHPFPHSLTHTSRVERKDLLSVSRIMWNLKELTLATTPKCHVGTSVGRCRLMETWKMTGWMGVVSSNTGSYHDHIRFLNLK